MAGHSDLPTRLVPLVLFGWIAWGFWISRSTKSPSAGTVVGLVIVGLLLLICSLACIRALAVTVSVILATPFFIAGFIVYVCIRVLLLILSPICVIRPRPFLKSNPISKENYCRLCYKCDNIITRSNLLLGSPWILAFPVKTYEFYNKSDLISSASSCHLCYLLYCSVAAFANQDGSDQVQVNQTTSNTNLEAGLRDFHQHNTSRNTEIKIWMEVHFWDSPTIRVKLGGAPIVKSEHIDIAWIDKGILPMLTYMEYANRIEENFTHKCYDSVETDSNDLSTWANDWVRKCSEGHEVCQNEFILPTEKAYLPLRLIDVQEAAVSIGSVHLVSTADLQPNAHVTYCALSHCWGKSPMKVKLTRDNVNTMKSIQVRTLPRNFRDAIAITRQLGCRYLWIDVLNIVQDDPEEWKVQAGKMGLVYANAKCVISATASEDSTGGCFRLRALNYSPCVLRASGDKLLTARTFQNLPHLPALFSALVQQAPLSMRGWTFQERYLAGRVLHFCKGFVLFECNTLMASEYEKTGQEYSVKPNIRSDGRLHSERDIEEVVRHVSQWIPSPPWSAYSRFNRKPWQDWIRERRWNTQYDIQKEKRAAMIKESARAGVRGAFEFL